MTMSVYLSALSVTNLISRMPAAVAQGIIWGLMALGVFITFRLLDIPDMTVDGSFATGGAVTVMLLLAGMPAWAALLIAIVVGVLTGLCTGFLHTKLGIPAILAGILTQFALYSINLRIMTKANQTASVQKFGMFWEGNGGKGFLLILGGMLSALRGEERPELTAEDTQEKADFAAEIPMGRFGTPREIAGVVSFLAGSDSDYVTAQIITADGGLT